MIKKSALTVMSALMAVSLAACGAGEEAGSTTGNKAGGEAPAGKKVKLSYWTNDRHDSEYIKPLIEDFNAKNKDSIEIEYVVRTDDFNQAVDLAFTSGQAPDILRVKDAAINLYHKKGYLAPIDKYLTDDQKKKFPAIDDQNRFDGKLYSLPNYGSTMRLVYNVELFEKAGIKSPPKTLVEMVDAAKKITEVGKTNGAYGFALNFKSPASAFGRSGRVIAELSGYGGFGFDFKTGRFDFNAFKDFTEAMKQMRDNGSLLPGFEQLDIDPLRAQFAEGKIGMYLSYSSEPGVYKSQFPAKIKWAAAPAPTIDGTVKGASGFVGGQWLGISEKSKYKDEAWKFLNDMYEQSVLQGYHEQGYGISMVPDVIAKAKAPNIGGIEGFLPNANDGVWPVSPTVSVQGAKFEESFLKYIMQGGDLNAIIGDLNKRYNDALDKGISSGDITIKPNPSFDPSKLGGQFAKK
ncbi:sugar ABC transporter substrate-binding protein [Paenibacillus filicis]|uniref:Sugar ABC transporter substrate-binding protein n=1 Tax=Paenibacillus filicis TaxID=669464 RepID=A0ABU9DW27_9BACL